MRRRLGDQRPRQGVAIISDAVELVAQSGSDKVWFEEVEVGQAFQSPFNGEAFAVMLLVNTPDVPPAYREALSEALLTAGCGYALCAGHDQEAWHASIDSAGVRHNSEQSDEVVMTTSHPNEALSEVVEFLLGTTYFEGLRRDRFLVLFVGKDPTAKDQIVKLVTARLGSRS